MVIVRPWLTSVKSNMKLCAPVHLQESTFSSLGEVLRKGYLSNLCFVAEIRLVLVTKKKKQRDVLEQGHFRKHGFLHKNSYSFIQPFTVGL